MYGGAEATQFYAENGVADQIFAGSATNDVLFYTTADSPIIESGKSRRGIKRSSRDAIGGTSSVKRARELRGLYPNSAFPGAV